MGWSRPVCPFSRGMRGVALLLMLALLATSGCATVKVPSHGSCLVNLMRGRILNQPTVGVADCPGCVEAGICDGSCRGPRFWRLARFLTRRRQAEPFRPPHSKFHPVPVRPVFSPPLIRRASDSASGEAVPSEETLPPPELLPPESVVPGPREETSESLMLRESDPHSLESPRPLAPHRATETLSPPRWSPDGRRPSAEGEDRAIPSPSQPAANPNSDREFEASLGPMLELLTPANPRRRHFVEDQKPAPPADVEVFHIGSEAELRTSTELDVEPSRERPDLRSGVLLEPAGGRHQVRMSATP
jgi:hypothetical protein